LGEWECGWENVRAEFVWEALYHHESRAQNTDLGSRSVNENFHKRVAEHHRDWMKPKVLLRYRLFARDSNLGRLLGFASKTCSTIGIGEYLSKAIFFDVLSAPG
jgi:hypothetical protein